jgi:serine/threonine protein kinase
VSSEGREAVLKRLRNAANLDRVARFQREIEVGQRLKHPYVVEVIEYDLSASKPYFVIEYYRHGSLATLDMKLWPLVRKLHLFQRICMGVAHAHSEGVIHRHLKPENILLRDLDTPVVADFGLCLIDDDATRLTWTMEAVGSRWYIAPELEDGFAKEVSPVVDVYSLGKILYWIISGGKIFAREKHREQEHDLTRSESKPSMYIVYELVDETLTRRSFKNASELAGAVETTIKRITVGANAIGWDIPQTCTYCGVGMYRRAFENLTEKNASAFYYGLKLENSHDRKWLILECDKCGNTQLFRSAEREKPFAWNPPKK